MDVAAVVAPTGGEGEDGMTLAIVLFMFVVIIVALGVPRDH